MAKTTSNSNGRTEEYNDQTEPKTQAHNRTRRIDRCHTIDIIEYYYYGVMYWSLVKNAYIFTVRMRREKTSQSLYRMNESSSRKKALDRDGSVRSGREQALSVGRNREGTHHETVMRLPFSFPCRLPEFPQPNGTVSARRSYGSSIGCKIDATNVTVMAMENLPVIVFGVADGVGPVRGDSFFTISVALVPSERVRLL